MIINQETINKIVEHIVINMPRQITFEHGPAI